jgi:Na+-translocating ferredoxin:NAD+ oxidoreductase RnfC subunit
LKEYPLITKKVVKNNKSIKNIQKKSCKLYRHTKGKFPKARIGKLVELRGNNNFIDLTEQNFVKQEYNSLTTDIVLEKLKQFDVCGFSGSGFPTEKKIQTVYAVPNRYPIGAEKILIKEVLGITIAQNVIPADCGILVLNVQTVHAIYEAIYGNCKPNTKFITVAE